MAEVFGVAAGAAGFVSLLGQFAEAISTLREIRRQVDKAPADIDNAIKELEFLLAVMLAVMSAARNFPGQQDNFLRHCQASCDEVEKHIRQFEEKVLPKVKLGKRDRIQRVVEMCHWKEDIEDLMRSLQKVRADLTLAVQVQS